MRVGEGRDQIKEEDADIISDQSSCGSTIKIQWLSLC